MDEYTAFAKVYDEFMDNVPYDEWGTYVLKLLEKYGCEENNLICELGCGTGNITKILANAGYDVIAIDNSAEMLSEAKKKLLVKDFNGENADNGNQNVLFLNQDMREFELYGTVKAIVSICDCINYITDFDDLVKVFKLVNNYLDAGGVFIFDINTRFKYESIGDETIAEDREDISFIWENFYDDETYINEYDLSIFIKGIDGRYDKFKEEHFQRAYSLVEIKEAARISGLRILDIFDAFTYDKPSAESERVYFILQETDSEVRDKVGK